MFLQILCSLLVFFVTRALWRRWHYDLHKIPSIGGWPIIGKGWELVQTQRQGDDLSALLGGWLQRIGKPKLSRVELFGKTVLFFSDMEYAKNSVLSHRGLWPKFSSAIDSMLPLIGNDITAKSMLRTPLPTPYSKAIRAVYAAAMQSSSLKKTMPKLETVLDHMMEIVEGERYEGPIELEKLCTMMTLDAIGVVAFDMDLGSLSNSSKLRELILDVSHIAGLAYFSPQVQAYYRLFPKSEGARKQQRSIDLLNREWNKITRTVLEKRDPPAGEEPIWWALREAVDPETNAPLQLKDFTCEIATVVTGAMDTTGHQLAWVLAAIASHEDVQTKLLQELRDHGLHGPESRSVSYEDLGSLPYLTAIIKETMRIAPIAIMTAFRDCPSDMTIMGYRIPKGTLVTVTGNRWYDTEEEWGDPRVFRPERWLGDEDMSKKNFFWFSYGPRDCPGQRLAMMEMRLCTIRMVTKYHLKLTRPFDDLLRDCTHGLVVESGKGIWIEVSLRDKFD